jgi:hypothetical protein
MPFQPSLMFEGYARHFKKFALQPKLNSGCTETRANPIKLFRVVILKWQE